MSASYHKQVRNLSFRITPELGELIHETRRKVGKSTQAFCTEAIERHIAHVERRFQRDVDRPERPVVREVIDTLRGR